jgi:hypothetical protein
MPAPVNGILFHGTSLHRWQSIRMEGCLRLPTVGDRKISLTPDRNVAGYWAEQSSLCDLQEGRGDGVGVVLVLYLVSLDASGHWLTGFRDAVWGDGECDWEQEIACWSSIDVIHVKEAQPPASNISASIPEPT